MHPSPQAPRGVAQSGTKARISPRIADWPEWVTETETDRQREQKSCNEFVILLSLLYKIIMKVSKFSYLYKWLSFKVFHVIVVLKWHMSSGAWSKKMFKIQGRGCLHTEWKPDHSSLSKYIFIILSLHSEKSAKSVS